MTLSRFLRGARPNPTSFSGREPWVLQRYDAATRAWIEVAEGEGRADAEAELHSPTGLLPPGTLARVMPRDLAQQPLEASAPRWYVRADGRAAPLPPVVPPHLSPAGRKALHPWAVKFGSAWELAWGHSLGHHVLHTLEAAGLDRKRRVGLAAALIAPALDLVPPEHREVHEGFLAVRAWAEGKARRPFSLDAARSAAEAGQRRYPKSATGVPVPRGLEGAHEACEALGWLTSGANWALGEALGHAATALALADRTGVGLLPAYARVLREDAQVLREAVPLAAVLDAADGRED